MGAGAEFRSVVLPVAERTKTRATTGETRIYGEDRRSKIGAGILYQGA